MHVVEGLKQSYLWQLRRIWATSESRLLMDSGIHLLMLSTTRLKRIPRQQMMGFAAALPHAWSTRLLVMRITYRLRKNGPRNRARSPRAG